MTSTNKMSVKGNKSVSSICLHQNDQKLTLRRSAKSVINYCFSIFSVDIFGVNTLKQTHKNTVSKN